MSIWSPPSAQQYPAQPSTAVDALMNRIRKLEGLIAELTKGSPLRQAGMGVSPGQVDFDGDVVIGGRIFTTGDAEFSGNTKIGGSLEVTGTLSLPSGIIDNDALASPAAFARRGGGESNFNVPTAGALVAQVSIPVPSGYSSAIVLALGTAAARNPTTAAAFLYVGAQIGTVEPNLTWALAAAGSYSNASGSASRVLTGLSGGVINVATRVASQGAAWNSTNSMANTDAVAIFLR